MRAYKICIDTIYYVEYDTIKIISILDDTYSNHTITITPIKITKEQYEKEPHYIDPCTGKTSFGIDYERRKAAQLINTAWELCIGELPQPSNVLYLPIVRFKKMFVDELEKYFLVWESEIRSEYEKSNHWLYINDPRVKKKLEEKLNKIRENGA